MGPGTTYVSHFASFSAAVAQARLEQEAAGNRCAGEERGHTPTMAELWERERPPGPSTYEYRFGGWNDALR